MQNLSNFSRPECNVAAPQTCAIPPLWARNYLVELDGESVIAGPISEEMAIFIHSQHLLHSQKWCMLAQLRQVPNSPLKYWQCVKLLPPTQGPQNV